MNFLRGESSQFPKATGGDVDGGPHTRKSLTAHWGVCLQHETESSLWQGTMLGPSHLDDAPCPESLGNYLLKESSIRGQRLSLIPTRAPGISSHQKAAASIQ